ncbi:MAG: hypothetical protein AMXMBFR7_11710 [Planctomycetota bacterium]
MILPLFLCLGFAWTVSDGLHDSDGALAVYAPAELPARTVESFRFIGAATTLREVTARLGAPDQDRGSGLFVSVYRLADGSEVLIGSADGAQVLYVRHGRAVLFERR